MCISIDAFVELQPRLVESRLQSVEWRTPSVRLQQRCCSTCCGRLRNFSLVSSGIHFAFGVEPVICLVAGCEAALFRSLVGELADPAMPLRRGQPMRHEIQGSEKIALRDRHRSNRVDTGWRIDDGRFCGRQPRFSPWNPCACNFACHKSSLSGELAPTTEHGSTQKLQQRKCTPFTL